jgi:16S rRNA G966 N2-methylase RsmD
LTLADVYQVEPERAKARARRDRAQLAVPEEKVHAYITRTKEAGLDFGRTGLVEFEKKQKMEEERLRKEELRRRAAALGRRVKVDEIRTGDFRTALDDLPNSCASLILVDPPYNQNSIPLYADLATVAARLLHDGGHFIAYAGHFALPAIFEAIGDRLRYLWLYALPLQGQHAMLEGIGVIVRWKPLVWYVKDSRWDKKKYVSDLLPSGAPDKELHDWRQSTPEAAYLVEQLTKPGDLVLDPMCGSGVVPAAALRLGRRALGVEIDPDRADVARNEMADARAARRS